MTDIIPAARRSVAYIRALRMRLRQINSVQTVVRRLKLSRFFT